MSKKRIFIQFVVVVLFLAIGVVGMYLLIEKRGKVKRRKFPVAIPMVRCIKVKSHPVQVVIHGEGTVRPYEQVSISPQIAGKVVWVSPDLIVGGDVVKDEILLKIDSKDYELALTLAKAKLKDAESALQLISEESKERAKEWRLHHASDPTALLKEPPPLVIKKPQLEAARAKVEAARAEIERAHLNLSRTKIRAPFDGKVVWEDVAPGAYLVPGKPVLSIYSKELVEIPVPLYEKDVFWIDVPGFTVKRGSLGSIAHVRAQYDKRLWQGRVVRTTGKIDEKTRMIRTVVQIKKPYDTYPPLQVGSFVFVDILGKTIPDAISIPRTALHNGKIVWVVDQERRLRFKKVTISIFMNDQAIISSGLNDGDLVVLSNLSIVTDGMRVRIKMDNKGEIAK